LTPWPTLRLPGHLLFLGMSAGLALAPRLGWTVTTLAKSAVDRQFIMFGASGAVLVTAITGLILNPLLPVAASRQPTITPTTAKVHS
jgi:hypothetical protein